MCRHPLRLVLPAFLLTVALVNGETVTVTTISDENNGTVDPARGSGTSLREALAYGTPPLAIEFAPALDGQTLSGGNLDTDKEVVIDATSLPAGIVLFSRNIEFLSGAEVTINNCRFLGTTHTQVRPLSIRAGATVTLNDCVVANYRFTKASGAREGVVANFGHLTLNRCLLENNASQQDKWEEGSGRGGAVYNIGVLEMNDCLLRRNDGDYDGGGVFSGGTATIRRSTFIENSAGPGAAVSSRSRYPWEGFGGTVHMFHCTISGNRGSSAVDLANGSLTSCTIVHNGIGGVIGRESVSIENSIIAHHDAYDLLGTFHTPGPNLIGGPSEATVGPIQPLIGDPQLSPLGYFGTQTKVHVPLPGSPALDAGVISVPDVDQGGESRPAGMVDLGSVEADALHERGALEQWTYQYLPPGVDQSFQGDPDNDRRVNGFEWGVGSDPFLFDLASSRHPHTRRGTDSGIEVVFGLNALAAPHLSFRLNRFTGPDEPTLVYELDGATGDVTTASNVTVSGSVGQSIVVDQSPPQPAGYYTLEVVRTVP